MPLKPECTTNLVNRLITFSEKRSKLTLINDAQTLVQKVVIDNCQITTGIRCDYFLLKDTDEYYIELKGQDVIHAIDQLVATIPLISADPKRAYKVCFVICTRSPLSSAEIQNYQVKLKKSHNIKLLVKPSGFSYNI